MKTIADIQAIRDKMKSQIVVRDKDTINETRIVVGMATCGISAGARPVFNTLMDEVATRQLHTVKVVRTGCMGRCTLEPIVEVFVPGQEAVTYCRVTPEKAKEIIEKHIIGGKICTQYLIDNEE